MRSTTGDNRSPARACPAERRDEAPAGLTAMRWRSRRGGGHQVLEYPEMRVRRGMLSERRVERSPAPTRLRADGPEGASQRFHPRQLGPSREDKTARFCPAEHTDWDVCGRNDRSDDPARPPPPRFGSDEGRSGGVRVTGQLNLNACTAADLEGIGERTGSSRGAGRRLAFAGALRPLAKEDEHAAPDGKTGHHRRRANAAAFDLPRESTPNRIAKLLAEAAPTPIESGGRQPAPGHLLAGSQ